MMGNWYGWNMMNNLYNPGFRLGFVLFLIWSFFWKGMALWRAAKEDSKPWFVALLIINTAGILEIIYLLFIAKEKLSLSTAPAKKSKKT